MTDARFPEPEPDDAEEVVVALTTGSSLWLGGEQAEAVRWLRKAQESADAVGNDVRSLELARAAADLAESVATAASDSQVPDDSPTAIEDHKPQLTKPPMPPPQTRHQAPHSGANGYSNGAGVDASDGPSSEAGGREPALGPVLTQALRVC